MSNKEQWMSNSYISVIVLDEIYKNQRVFINTMDFSLGWKQIT